MRRRQQKSDNAIYNQSIISPLEVEAKEHFRITDASPLVDDKYKTMDAWVNVTANINEGNSLTRFNNFMLNRLSYAECANMGTDPIINKAINTISNEIFAKGGEIIVKNKNDDSADLELKNNLEEFISDNKIYKTLQLACVKALQFGGSYIFINTTDTNLEEPLYLNEKTTSFERFIDLKILEAWQVAPASVNNFNPIDKDYMSPELLYVIGGSTNIHRTRLIPIIFFEVPFLIKPLFNYLGISLTQLMKDYVSNADTIRQALSDLFLRFRSLVIKTSPHNIKDNEYKERIKYSNQTMNNLGLLLLTQNEELQQLITPITGLDNIQSQAYELMVATSGIPATKLLGISPRGFNATGEHDLRNYYDNIASYQTNVVKPMIENILQYIITLKFGRYIKNIDFVFNPLGEISNKELAEIRNLNADYISKLKNSDIIGDIEALEAIKNNDFSFENIQINNEDLDFDKFENENETINQKGENDE